jgi:hypothetical protein
MKFWHSNLDGYSRAIVLDVFCFQNSLNITVAYYYEALGVGFYKFCESMSFFQKKSWYNRELLKPILVYTLVVLQGHAIKKHLVPENYALEMCAFQSQFVRPGENYGLRDDVDDIRYKCFK